MKFLEEVAITLRLYQSLFKSITMFHRIGSSLRNISSFRLRMGIFHIILSVELNIVMDLNNVMLGTSLLFRFPIGCFDHNQTSRSALFIKTKNHVRACPLLKPPCIHFIFARIKQYTCCSTVVAYSLN